MRTKTASAKTLILFIAIITAALLVPGMVKGGTTGAPVEKTGQTTCWDAVGNQISCSGTGQDGELQKGVAWPVPRFTDNGNGTVKDNLTGLIWLKNANPCGLKNWPDALAYCNSLASGTAGLTDGSLAGDWRLPNVKELQSLLDFSSYNPVLPAGHPFTGVQNLYYWTSTTTLWSAKTYLAHKVAMSFGMTVHGVKATDVYTVWPVRGGQCGIDTSVICVPKTGQTTCWDAAGNQISCTGTGQDGELQKGVAWPSPRFTDNGNGTVKDNLTGLIWLKNANPCGPKSWVDALAYCNGLASGTAGLTDGSLAGDWRLPNIKELGSLIDFSRYNPAVPAGHPFTGVQNRYYWSSDSDLFDAEIAWNIYFPNGVSYDTQDKSFTYTVWPVREEVSTLIKLASFHATPKAGKVIVAWSTASEIDNAGFNLFCSEAENGPYSKLNNSLIPAKGSSTQGSDYEFIDHDVQNRKTYYYKLEDIDLNGTSTMHGPVSATPRLIFGIFGK